MFYCNNQAITISRNSGQPEYLPEPPEALVKKAGDGQVSGLSDFQNAESFYRKLSLIFDK